MEQLNTDFNLMNSNTKPNGNAVLLDEKEPKKGGLWEKMFRKNKLKKPNAVAVLYIRNNGIAEPMEVEVRDGFYNIYGKTYHENRACIYRMGKDRTPLAVIPEWSLTPLGTKDWEDKDLQEKFGELQDHVLKGIRNAELVRMYGEQRKPLNMKAIILGGLALIVVVAVVLQYT